MQGIVHDITNLKKAEKATLQVEKLAATGRLVSTLAHEVRNPLNNINLSVEHLREEVGADENATYLGIIQRNSTRIGALITELLNSSRPTEMKSEPQILQSIMDESISDAIDRLTLQGINMQIKYPDEPVIVSVDKDKLKLAFSNIIVNATEAISRNREEFLWYKCKLNPDYYQRQWLWNYRRKYFPPFRALFHQQAQWYGPWPCQYTEYYSK